MMFYNLHVLDIAIILAYLIVCLVIGFKTSGSIKSIRDYAIGTGHISTAVLVGTFFATDIGAGQTVGVVEKIHTVGLIFIIALLCKPLCWLFASWVFSGNIGYFKDAGCISVSDIIEKIYGSTGRWIINCAALCNAIGILALQVTAITYLFNYFLGISSTYCAIVAFAVLVAYSVMGGIRAVAITDLMQACVFFVGVPLMCFLAADNIGVSFENIIDSLPDKYASVDFSADNIILAISVALVYVSSGTGIPFIQRYLMANNETQLRRSLRDCFYISIPFTLVVIIAGLISVVATPDINPNMAFYHLVNTYLPIGLKGFVVTGLLAVIMSTADSWLNTASVICAHDIVSKLFPRLSEKQILLASRAFTVIIAAIAVIWAISHGKSMMDFVWFIGNASYPLMIAPIIFGLFKVRSTSKAFIVSCIAAIIGILFGYYLTGQLARVSTLTGIIGSAIGLSIAHYWQQGLSKPSFKLTMKVPSLLYSPWRTILKFSEKQVRIHGHNYYLAGGLGIIFFISSIFLYNPYGHSEMLLGIRAISALLCIGLIFHERLGLGAKQQQYLALYYHLTLMVIFPLISGYMMMLTGYSVFWVMSFALAMIIMNFVCGITMTAILMPIGLLGAYLLRQKSGVYVIPIPVSAVHIGFTIILLVITARVRHNFQRSMIEMKEMYSTMLAHQVMQPIAQMSMSADHIGSILKSGTLSSTEDLKEVKSTVESLRKMGYKAKELVNGLLLMSREDIAKAQDVRAYYIQDVIEEALSIYSEKELARISVDKSRNFRFNASKMFMVEVIRNLISNSFKYAGKNAKIEIFCGPRALYIRDNGRGIEKERLRYIFDHTRNSTGQTTGAGFGLAFVKRVVDSFSCAIICRSELGKYTEFVIGFPRL